MKRHVALSVLALTALWVGLSHLQWMPTDNGHLLAIDGRAVDAQGWLADTVNRLQRDCTSVHALNEQDVLFGQALAAVQAYSPPASRSARLQAAWRAGPWLLVEAQFETLLSSVVLLRDVAGQVQIEPLGIWSGQTHPWRAAPLIRAYLARQVPTAPPALLACFEPQLVH
ncbi:MAG: hypothetical protein ACOYB1_10975 [Limnohabitans sp.]